ncbi:hypothetical protein TNIN_252671 [Trichonephila inaurata madagascariensis]|uniref:Uncharacterized protein n=1 Tax=Trichonephila inaurata madagascariensis TaxID=2747483 RepID=A0A8X6X3A9_9ARAC|nr:hypothetical protein TNIN_252671 [Trichonephila inaurata madagascariensis]
MYILCKVIKLYTLRTRVCKPVYLQVIMDMTMSHSVTIDGTCLTEEMSFWWTVGELLQRKNNDLVVSAEISGQILFRRCIRDGTERVRVRPTSFGIYVHSL